MKVLKSSKFFLLGLFLFSLQNIRAKTDESEFPPEIASAVKQAMVDASQTLEQEISQKSNSLLNEAKNLLSIAQQKQDALAQDLADLTNTTNAQTIQIQQLNTEIAQHKNQYVGLKITTTAAPISTAAPGGIG